MPLLLENVGGFFLLLIGYLVLGVFHGDLDFFISMKNPSNYPIKSFALLKKITTLIFKKSVALIVILDWQIHLQPSSLKDWMPVLPSLYPMVSNMV